MSSATGETVEPCHDSENPTVSHTVEPPANAPPTNTPVRSFLGAWAALANSSSVSAIVEPAPATPPLSPLDVDFDKFFAVPSRFDDCMAPRERNPPNPLLFQKRVNEGCIFVSLLSRRSLNVVGSSPKKLKRSEADAILSNIGPSDSVLPGQDGVKPTRDVADTHDKLE